MDDEVLAAPAALIGVVLARVYERRLNPLAVDRHGGLIGVLLDDRKQVRQQPPLGVGQLGAGDRPVTAAGAGRREIRDSIDRDPAANQRGGSGLGLRWPRRARGGRGRPQPLLGGRFALLRYCRPSSCRRAYAR